MAEGRQALSALYRKRVDVPLLILSAFILLGTGLSLPLFHVTQMVFWKGSYSVITSIQELFKQKEYFLGGIILLFSVVFPITKLLSLFVLWTAKLSDPKRLAGLRWLEFLGKWSMLDVLILALTIVAVKLKSLATVRPQEGVYVFSVAILLSMIATMQIEYLSRKASKK